jgi:segregation and condensation protein A
VVTGTTSPPLPPDAPVAPVRQLELRLDGFEGPLDLLLHLIRKHQIDIFQIPIAFITEEYLRYLDAMDAAQLAMAGEYLVMAATLLHIKSQMLLPRRSDAEGAEGADEGEAEDPRTQLVRRLLEYQRYRDAAEQLNHREMEGRDVFRRPVDRERLEAEAGPGALQPASLYHLMKAFARLLQGRPVASLHEITPEAMSLRETVTQLAAHLQEHARCTLLELVYAFHPEPGRHQIVMTFLALLELARLRMVRLFQSRLSGHELFVERAVLDASDVALPLDGLEEPE